MDILKKFFIEEGFSCYDFFDFIEDKIVVLPSNSEIFWYGCHPILNDEGILIDIRVVVPEIVNLEDMVINVHEFMHAIELYDELGTVYEEKRDIREGNAKVIEKIFLRNKKI